MYKRDFLDKEAGLKQWKRILEADLKSANPRLFKDTAENRQKLSDSLGEVTEALDFSRKPVLTPEVKLKRIHKLERENYIYSKDYAKADKKSRVADVLGRYIAGNEEKIKTLQNTPEGSLKKVLKNDNLDQGYKDMFLDRLHNKQLSISPLVDGRSRAMSDIRLTTVPGSLNKHLVWDSEIYKNMPHLTYYINTPKYNKLTNEMHLDPLDRLKGANRANIVGKVTAHNKDIDIRNSHRHDIKSSKPLDTQVAGPEFKNTYTGRARQSGNLKLNYVASEPIYYSGKGLDYDKGGKHADSLTPKKIIYKDELSGLKKQTGLKEKDPEMKYAPIWVTPYPDVAAGYGNKGGVIYAFKNTPKLVEGGSGRSHKHLARDTRGMTADQITALENKGSIWDKGIPGYERVLNYKPEVFKENLKGVYRSLDYTARMEKLKVITDQHIDGKPILVKTRPIYQLGKKNTTSGMERLFGEHVTTPKVITKVIKDDVINSKVLEERLKKLEEKVVVKKDDVINKKVVVKKDLSIPQHVQGVLGFAVGTGIGAGVLYHNKKSTPSNKIENKAKPVKTTQEVIERAAVEVNLELEKEANFYLKDESLRELKYLEKVGNMYRELLDLFVEASETVSPVELEKFANEVLDELSKEASFAEDRAFYKSRVAVLDRDHLARKSELDNKYTQKRTVLENDLNRKLNKEENKKLKQQYNEDFWKLIEEIKPAHSTLNEEMVQRDPKFPRKNIFAEAAPTLTAAGGTIGAIIGGSASKAGVGIKSVPKGALVGGISGAVTNLGLAGLVSYSAGKKIEDEAMKNLLERAAIEISLGLEKGR